jgi:ubiquinone/menaquinone biosynthesis C-methylase UbiE
MFDVRNTNFAVYSDPKVVAYYSELEQLTPCEQMLFQTFLTRGMQILDLGVGGGRTTPFLSQLASQYVGVDYSEKMIQACQNRFPELQFAMADAANLSQFSDASFDAVVFSFNGVDYLYPDHNRLACFQECRRVLKDGGIFIFSSHNPRALFPAGSQDPSRSRAVAEKITRTMQWPFPVVLGIVSCARFALRLIRTTIGGFRRAIRRLPTKAFWMGQGFIWDAAHGGLLTHSAVPSRVMNELGKIPFEFVAKLPEHFPGNGGTFRTRWYYYVFRKK